MFNTWDVCSYFDHDDDDDYGGGGDIGTDSDDVDAGPNINPDTVEALIEERVDQSGTHQVY